MISKFLKDNSPKTFLYYPLAIEVISEVLKIDKDKVLELLTAYINNN